MHFPFRNYFSRRDVVREEKASRTSALIALLSSNRPRWTPRDYHALAREGYAKNPIAFRSVRMIAEAAANVRLLLYEGAREHDEHPLLALLARPNPRQTGADLIEQLAGYLLVSGNAYLERVSVLDEVRELHVLRPDRMKVIAGSEGWAEAYEYRAGGSSVRFAMSETPAPILHLALFNPLDDHYGMSPLEAAQASLDVHNAASAWNKALLDNAARPSGALVYSASGGNLSDEQFERLKAELEAHYQGAANAGRPLLLEGGLDWKGLSLSPKDMDFVEAKHIAAREIALSFGVPPMLLGIPGDNTYSNYAEANRAFYRQTVVPLVSRIACAFGHWLGESFGGNLRLAPDLDEVPALSIEREALWKRVGEAAFLTDDEKRAATGYEPLPASSLTTLLAKYSPDQPRVPAGNPDGGQWTSGREGGEAAGDESGSGSNGGEANDVEITPVSQDNDGSYRVDLLEEEERGGHVIREHVGKSESYLKARVKREAFAIVERGDSFEGLGVGSFSSLSSATKLINSTLAENQAIVDRVVRGQDSIGFITSYFNSPTGQEAYLSRFHAQPYMRDTYGVSVVIVRDPRSPKGFRIQSAFPRR
jgi:HK97 family phage portal protein